MNKTLIYRVVMRPNGRVSIFSEHRESIPCTPNALISLLGAPQKFYYDTFLKYHTSTDKKSKTLAEMPGLTLGSVYSDGETVLHFPKLFEALLASYKETPDEEINLSKFLSSSKFTDEKHFLMKFFAEFNTKHNLELKFDEKNGVSEEDKNRIFNETYNTLFHSMTPEKKIETKSDDSSNESDENGEPAELEWWTFREFEEKRGVHYSTIQKWKTTVWEEYVKPVNEGSVKYRIRSDAPIPDTFKPYNKGKSSKKPRASWSESLLRNCRQRKDTYQGVQEYLQKTELVNERIREYFTSLDEVIYYIDKNYFEMRLNNEYHLVIKVNLDYISKKYGCSNADLIRNKKSPVVPEDESQVYHLHHIGQKRDSPFAIIPQKEHETNHSKLHDNRKHSEIPRDSYDTERKFEFWEAYLSNYEKFGSFDNMKKASLKKRRDKANEKAKTVRENNKKK